MNYSANDFIRNNDFEGAKEKLEQARPRWIQHWFDTCEIIFNSCAEWSKKYILDPINRIITKIKNNRIVKNVYEGVSHTYIIKMYDDNNNYVFLKVGKANDVDVRMRQLCKKGYVDTNIEDVEILKTWELPAPELAEMLEKYIQYKLKQKYTRIPNDRFVPIELSSEQMVELENYYNAIIALA